MSSKGMATDKRILDAAEKLFIENGFTAVTMKKISTESMISRGGLYRHYSSTSTIFAAVIEREQKKALASLKRAKDGEIAPNKILEVYIQHRMDSILHRDLGIDNAIVEFAICGENGKEIAEKRAKNSVAIIEELITMSNQNGVYHCKNVKAAAKHICFIIEGMCKHSVIMPLTKTDVESQFRLIRDMLK